MPLRLRRLVVATATIPACLFLAAPAHAQSTPTAVVIRPGAAVVLDTAPCVRAVAASAGTVDTATADGRMYAIYRAPDTLSGDADVTIVTGPKASADGKTCEPAAAKQFRVGADRSPQVSDSALGEAFRILMTAFVLALLLESGFALLFNWRLFLEFFDGKAWRSPIMLLGALMIVRTFDLDLMASLFDAYSGAAGAPSKGGWFTSVLTAMILAGGSVGVNRILVGLGIRSQTRADALEPQPEPHEAWIAIRVRGAGARRVQVNVDEVTPPPGEEPPTTVGMVRPRNIAQRLRELLFPSGSRVPPRGGRRVDPAKSYRITVVDPAEGGRIYDALGNPIPTIASARLFRFGARAIVDFEVTV